MSNNPKNTQVDISKLTQGIIKDSTPTSSSKDNLKPNLITNCNENVNLIGTEIYSLPADRVINIKKK